MAIPAPKDFDAQTANNLEDMEKQFAVKAVNHLMTYWSILERNRGSSLRLTKIDDEILEHLNREFPDFDPAANLDEDEIKSPQGKERWRNFIMQYEKKVADYNFGTILRIDPKTEYSEKGTIFVPRMQFYAIEIARNKNGLNDWVYGNEHPDKNEKEKNGGPAELRQV